MKGYNVYSKIQQYRQLGFSQRQVARRLEISRKTVKRYWEMPVDEYEEMSQGICRMQALDRYEKQIVQWLLEYPTLTAAQVSDWLKEHYRAEVSERTVSRYVKGLREKYGLKKSQPPREYEAVPELPMGQQMQVDFGQMAMENVDGGRTTVYVAVFVLSRSRYKYAQMQSRPFTSVDLVRICHDCFQYMGGMPAEMVFDQDSIVCVSENAGDIVYTYEFEKFRQECKMAIRMCRGADPESKGKIENAVKYVKGNFLSHRLYVDDCILNGGCLDWLERTANAKVHGTTKLVPAEVFKEEREYLRPLPVCDQAKRPVVCRTVRKDNTIIYDSNRYSVPLGTYTTQPEELDADLDGKATDFLTTIRTDKSRYARDQFRLIRSLLDQYGLEAALEAIGFCRRSRLYSANTMRDYLEHRAALSGKPQPVPAVPTIPVDSPKYHVATQKRPLDVYAKVGGAGC